MCHYSLHDTLVEYDTNNVYEIVSISRESCCLKKYGLNEKIRLVSSKYLEENFYMRYSKKDLRRVRLQKLINN